MNLRHSVIASALVHLGILVVLFIVKSSDPLMIPGPDVVQVSLVEPGMLPSVPVVAATPPREPVVAPPEPDEGVKIEQPKKKKPAKEEPETPKEKPAEKPVETATPGPVAPALPSAAVGPAGLSGDVAVDAQDFEFTYYLMLVRGKIAQNWSAAGVSAGDQRRVVVYFRIARDGGISGIRVETPSGADYFDRSALRAVGVSSPLPPLPLGFNGPYLGVHFGFDYAQP